MFECLSEWPRRRFLKAGCASFVGSALGGCSLLDDDKVELRRGWRTIGIDVHCHIFNASDLPVEGFVRRVALGDHEDQVVFPATGPEEGFVAGLGAFLIAILSNKAKTAAEEIRDILEAQPTESFALHRRSNAALVQEILNRFSFPVPLRQGEGPVESAPGTPPSDYKPLLKAIEREIGGKQKRRGPEESGPSAPDAEELLESKGFVGRNVRWALKLLRPRRKQADELDRLYGGKEGIQLFTPALVDFSAWLNIEPRSPLADQIEVMDHIQRRRSGHSMVHGFAPFDPWRQVSFDTGTGQGPAPMELIKHAVMEAGFIGVKLYPPMGFLPSSNQGSGIPYPERASSVRDFPQRLDNALSRLFAWCAENSVPVMAHATNSNGAGIRYAQRAHPNNWRKVLLQHPNLRLNLAHFGGFDETLAGQPLSSSWEWAVGRLLKNNKDLIFADLSYLNEFLGPASSPDVRAPIRRWLKKFLMEFDPNVESLLHGSDWIMLGREAGHENYFRAIRDLLSEIGLDKIKQRNFFFENSVRFLGLHKGQLARSRLENYYRRHGLEQDRLNIFDRPVPSSR